MSWQTNKNLIAMRSLARRTGLSKILGKMIARSRYESAFDDAMFDRLRAGDVVWDIGANVGYYTRRFAERVGAEGVVVAFEPVPMTAERLRKNVEGLANVRMEMAALGAENGRVVMRVGEDNLGATSRIVDGGDGVPVEILTGDTLIRHGTVPAPTFLKIDTEGFELDVLRGMTALLRQPGLSSVFVEVHFGILAERGIPMAPIEIEDILAKAGFSTRWVDPSHIAAVRDLT